MVGDYRARFSRRCSDGSDDSDDASSVEGETTSSVYSAGKEYMAIEWTNEKHSLYLKAMEASFVHQLYSSLNGIGNKENLPEKGPSTKFGSCRKTSQEQFKVLHDGFWQKINVKEPEHRINGRQGGSSHGFLKSPWIKHYKPLPKTSQTLVMDEDSFNLETQVIISGSTSSLQQISREGCSHLRDHDQISIGEEVSDQNFDNEVTKDENGGSKKMKTVMNESSSADQVVPLRKTSAT